MTTTHFSRGPSLGAEFFRDKDGFLTTTKAYDAELTYDFDFTDMLDSGETITSATWEPSGPTITSSLATPVVSVNVVGCGTAKLTLTTNTQKRIENFRWIGEKRKRDYA